MESIAWMAWTLPTAIFFALLASTLAVMTWLAAAYPEAERIGVLRLSTTRRDRLFVALLLLGVSSSGPDGIAAVPSDEEGYELASLWLATLVSLATAVLVFRTV